MSRDPKDTGVDGAALDAAVGKVRAGLPSWVALPVVEKAGLVHRLRRRLGDEAPGMVEAWRVAQGLEPDSFWVGDVWGGLVPLAIMIRGWESTLTRLARHERLVPPAAIHRDPEGRVTVDVFPQSRTDQLLFLGYSGRVRLQPGTSVAEVESAGDSLREGQFPSAGVTLLLAAGNFAFLPATDALALLLAHGCTVVMKLNPVNAYLRPAFERVFVEFIDAGWLAVVEGGPEVGAHLAHHPDIDRVHMTGSASTYDAVVWGTGPDAERARESGRRLLAKPFTAELGGVNPLIVTPGRWTRHDVRRRPTASPSPRCRTAGTRAPPPRSSSCPTAGTRPTCSWTTCGSSCAPLSPAPPTTRAATLGSHVRPPTRSTSRPSARTGTGSW